MIKFFSFTFVLALFVAASIVNAASKKKNEQCDKDVFDNCANRLLMLSDETFIFPTNTEKMNVRCKEIKPLERCTKDYSQNCLRGDTKNSISVLMYGISKTNKGYCTNTKRKNLFISMGECLNTHKRKLGKLLDQMNRDYHGVKSYENPKLRIPLSCCNYYKFKQSVITFLTGKCPDAVVQETEALIEGYAHDILQLLCGDYTEESDKCSKIIGKTPKYTRALNYKVFLIPLVDILESI